MSRFAINKCNQLEFKELFYSTILDERENKTKIASLTDLHHLLHRAVATGNLEMSELLISCGANINL